MSDLCGYWGLKTLCMARVWESTGVNPGEYYVFVHVPGFAGFVINIVDWACVCVHNMHKHTPAGSLGLANFILPN